MIPLLVEASSPTNVIWWGLVRYYLFLGSAAAIIVFAWMIHNIVHNRMRGGYVRKEQPYKKHEGEWGNWKGTLMILLMTGSVLAFVEYQTFASTGLYNAPKGSDPISIGVIGRQWDWVFVYPNGFQSVGNLTVPQNAEVLLNITSSDVVHSFTIPSLSVARDAVPDHFNTVWINATQTGSYLILCKEFCGVGHALMWGTLTVLSPTAYNQWYSSLQTVNTNISATYTGVGGAIASSSSSSSSSSSGGGATSSSGTTSTDSSGGST